MCSHMNSSSSILGLGFRFSYIVFFCMSSLNEVCLRFGFSVYFVLVVLFVVSRVATHPGLGQRKGSNPSCQYQCS